LFAAVAVQKNIRDSVKARKEEEKNAEETPAF